MLLGVSGLAVVHWVSASSEVVVLQEPSWSVANQALQSVLGVCAVSYDHLVWQRPLLCMRSSQSEKALLCMRPSRWLDIIELQDYTNTWQCAGHCTGLVPLMMLTLCQCSPSMADSMTYLATKPACINRW